MGRLSANGTWPKLKRKAAARHLAKCAPLLINTISGDGNEDAMVYGVGASTAPPALVRALGRRLIVLYGSLSSRALAADRRAWEVMPKLLLFAHLCEDQTATSGNLSA